MTTRWMQAETVLSTDLGDEMVLLDVGTRAMHTLNPTGRVVWSSIEDGLEATVERMCTQFDIDAVTAQTDAVELVEELVASGLLVERT